VIIPLYTAVAAEGNYTCIHGVKLHIRPKQTNKETNEKKPGIEFGAF